LIPLVVSMICINIQELNALQNGSTAEP